MNLQQLQVGTLNWLFVRAFSKIYITVNRVIFDKFF